MSPSYPDTPLYISDNCPLIKVEYLGVTLTSDLNWANHNYSYHLQQGKKTDRHVLGNSIVFPADSTKAL